MLGGHKLNSECRVRRMFRKTCETTLIVRQTSKYVNSIYYVYISVYVVTYNVNLVHLLIRLA